MTTSQQTNFEKLINFFTGKINTNDPSACWEWLRAKSSDGYGLVWYEAKWQQAHRVAWMIYYGSVSKDKWVLHKCNNKCCVNPQHLHLGSHIDNVRDAINSNSYIKYHQRKLTSAEVIAVRRLLGTNITLRQIASEFDVSHQTIWKIARGFRYAK